MTDHTSPAIKPLRIWPVCLGLMLLWLMASCWTTGCITVPGKPVVVAPMYRAVAVVVTGEHGALVSGASVTLDDTGGAHRGITNADGYVLLTPVLSSLTDSHLWITADGYLPYAAHQDVPSGNATIRVTLVAAKPPEPEFTPLPRLVARGAFFGLETGERFTVIEASDFNLLNRWQHGEDITPILQQRKDAGFNTLRVWTLYHLPPGIGVFTDIDYSRVGAFLDLCARYGFYVELTAYTSLERPEHWPALIAAVQGKSNALAELGNELDLPVNQIDMSKYSRPIDILASHGSSGSEGTPPWGTWDYAGFHTNGANEEQRKIGHNAMEVWPGPTVTNETSRYPDVGMWVGSDQVRRLALAFDASAGAALLVAGSCFHSVQGKNSTLWDNATLAVAKAWAAGARSVPLSCQAGPYVHRQDLETAGLLRVYQRGGDPACIVKIRN